MVEYILDTWTRVSISSKQHEHGPYFQGAGSALEETDNKQAHTQMCDLMLISTMEEANEGA